jgi:hypothetical protein
MLPKAREEVFAGFGVIASVIWVAIYFLPSNRFRGNCRSRCNRKNTKIGYQVETL